MVAVGMHVYVRAYARCKLGFLSWQESLELYACLSVMYASMYLKVFD